jgi:16S rRNA (guanine966-N2)-methyltransferase
MPRNNRTGYRTRRVASATSGPDQSAPNRGPARQAGLRGDVRIIGGEWRGRKLHFPQTGAVRPTPDRVRETVFNWLQFELAGRRCLDLFAGSGALGVEALSRGAAHAVFVESDPASARAIQATLRTLGCERGRVECQDAFACLRRPAPEPFDVVFLDPPYGEDCLPRVCDALEQGGWLAPAAWIYLEDPAERGAPRLPAGWALMRSKRAGDVGYHLARRGAPAQNDENNRGGA